MEENSSPISPILSERLFHSQLHRSWPVLRTGRYTSCDVSIATFGRGKPQREDLCVCSESVSSFFFFLSWINVSEKRFPA